MTRSDYYYSEPWKRRAAGAFDALVSLLLRPRIGRRIDPGRLRKLLLLRLDHIGDLLMTTPTFRALRKAYPSAEIHVAARAATAEVLAGNPYVDRIIVFNAPWTTTGKARAGWGEAAAFSRKLRRERYDCVVAFRADPRDALLVLATGAPFRLGYGARGGGFCFTHLLPFVPTRHEIKRNLSLLKTLGVESDGEKMDIYPSAEEERKAEALLMGIGGEKGRGWAGIHPGAASLFKRWPEESFARLGDLLSAQGFRILLLGGPAEGELLESVSLRMKSPAARLAPLSLGVLAALIRRLDVLVCNDTAPSHIAQAVGTKSVVIYGPTHDAVTGPLDRERHAVARKPFPCAPCWLPGTPFCCEYDLRCLKELEPEKVIEEVKKVTRGY